MTVYDHDMPFDSNRPFIVSSKKRSLQYHPLSLRDSQTLSTNAPEKCFLLLS